MKINKYQIYLFLFFIIFLTADVVFILIARKIYADKIINTNDGLKISDKLNNSQLSNFLQINYESTNKKNILNLLLKFDDNILMKRLAIQLYDIENKTIINSFIFNNPESNFYKLSINSLKHKRFILRANFINSLNKKYFSAYRIIFNKNKYEIIQVN